jgi:hypothetical protein
VVEREAGPVGGSVPLVKDGAQVAGGYAGLEDQGLVRFGDAVAVVEDGKGTVAALFEGGGDEDAPGAGVAGVAQELEEGVLDVVEARGGAAGSLLAGEAGEARAEVAVGAFFQ